MPLSKQTADYVKEDLKTKIKNFGHPRENTQTVIKVVIHRTLENEVIPEKKLPEILTGSIVGAINGAKEAHTNLDAVSEGILSGTFDSLKDYSFDKYQMIHDVAATIAIHHPIDSHASFDELIKGTISGVRKLAQDYEIEKNEGIFSATKGILDGVNDTKPSYIGEAYELLSKIPDVSFNNK